MNRSYGKGKLKLIIDTSQWFFPFALHLVCIGVENRPYCISIDFLCFGIFWIFDLGE